MAQFNLGDTVFFTPECGHVVVGTVVRLNKKSVTVASKDGHQWRVAPGFLSRVNAPNEKQKGQYHSPDIVAAWLNELPQDARDEAEFSALTGLRATEVKRVRSHWVEKPHEDVGVPAILRVPAASSKTRKERIVGLVPEAHEILKRLMTASPGSGPLFSQSEHKKARIGAAKRIGYNRIIKLRDLRTTYLTIGAQGTGDAAAAQAGCQGEEPKEMEPRIGVEPTTY